MRVKAYVYKTLVLHCDGTIFIIELSNTGPHWDKWFDGQLPAVPGKGLWIFDGQYIDTHFTFKWRKPDESEINFIVTGAKVNKFKRSKP